MEERPILELKLLRYLRTILLLRNRGKLEKLLRMQKVSEQLVESPSCASSKVRRAF